MGLGLKKLFTNPSSTKLGAAMKRKEGGTVVGNMLRSGARAASGGLLGNGAMMLTEGQSAEANNIEWQEMLGGAVDNAGIGITLGNQTNGGKSMLKNPAALVSTLKTVVLWVIFPVILIIITVRYFKNKNKKQVKKF